MHGSQAPSPTVWERRQDRYTRRSFAITTSDDDSDSEAIRVRTYADTLGRYRVHPEPKSLCVDGTPCRPSTAGLLQRRPVVATSLTYIGKEANDLEEVEAGITAGDEALNTYTDPATDPWRTIWLPRLAEIPARTIVDEFPKYADGRTISPSQVKEIRAGRAVPHHRNQRAHEAIIRTRIGLSSPRAHC